MIVILSVVNLRKTRMTHHARFAKIYEVEESLARQKILKIAVIFYFQKKRTPQ
jgi:hypothetical protein